MGLVRVVTELVPVRVWSVVADDGTPVHVEEIGPFGGGGSDVTLIGVHGFALTSASWHFQRREIAACRSLRVRQVFYDHRGHGRSGRSGRDTYTIGQLARDLQAVIRAMAPDGPVVLAGHSLGGMTIMELARREPALFAERVRGVAILTSAVGEVGPGLPLSVLSKLSLVTRAAQWLAERQPGLVELACAAHWSLARPVVRRLAFGSTEPSRALVDFVVEMLRATPVAELLKFVDNLGSHDHSAALTGLRGTDVQVIGAAVDRVTPFPHSERVAAALPDAHLVRVPDAGHLVQLECPDAVTSRLIALLERASSSGKDSQRQNLESLDGFRKRGSRRRVTERDPGDQQPDLPAGVDA
jgi:pimeloyl-ACP methyl ester carboxylesterase